MDWSLILEFFGKFPKLFESVFNTALHTAVGKVLVTFVLLFLGNALNKGLSWGLRKANHEDHAKGLRRLVLVKNLVRVIVAFLIFGLWMAQISSFIFSIAAFFGALIIAGKEAVLSVFGYLNITFARPFRIGDYIEVGDYQGRVIDVDMMNTTLSEVGPSKKQTGRQLTFPNSLVFTQPVRNLSSLGKFGLHLVEFILPVDDDLDKAEEIVLVVAERVCSPWLAEAIKHFDRIEVSRFIELPPGKPEVYWQPLDGRSHKMIVRLACPIHKRGNVQQELYKRFWVSYRKATRISQEQNKGAASHSKAEEGSESLG